MIQSAGVEIEGAWVDLPKAFFSDNNTYKHKIFRTDSSVEKLKVINCSSCGANKLDCHCNSPYFEECDPENNLYYFVGECASFPYTRLNDLIKWMDKFYADRTNKYCGLHFHMKPENNAEYMRLNSKKFYYDLLYAIETFGRTRNINADSELWKRLKGRNHFCKKKFEKLASVKNETSDRYNAINYCARKHGTIEVRVLPAFQKKRIAIDAVRYIYDFTNNWLNVNKFKPKKHSIRMEFKEIDL